MASSTVCPPVAREPGLPMQDSLQPVTVNMDVQSPGLAPIPEDRVSTDCSDSPPTGTSLVCETMRPYRCKQCRQRFRALNHLQEHSRLHSGHRPYACPLCSRAYRQQSQLHLHLRSHGQDSSLRCGRCKLALPHMAALASHTLHEHGRAASSSLPAPRPCKRSLEQTLEMVRDQANNAWESSQAVLERVENLLASTLHSSPLVTLDSATTEVNGKEPDKGDPMYCHEWKRDSNANVALLPCEPVAGPPDSEQASMSPCLHRHSPSASPSSSQPLQNHQQQPRSLVSPISMESVDEMPDDLSHHGDELLHRDPPDNLSRHGDDDRPGSARLDSFDSDEPPSLERMSPAVCKSPPLLTKMASSCEGKLSRLTQSLECTSSPKVNSISPQYLACSSAREEASSIGNGSPPSDMELGKASSTTGQYSDYSDLGQGSPASEVEAGKVAPRNHFSRFMDGEASPRSDAEVSKPSTPYNHGSSSGQASPERDCGKVEYSGMEIRENTDSLVTHGEAQSRPSSPVVKVEPADADCSQKCEEEAMEVEPSEIKEEVPIAVQEEPSTEVLDPQPGPSSQPDEPAPACQSSTGSFFSEFAKFVSQLEQKGVNDATPAPPPSATPKSPIRIKILPPRPPTGSSSTADLQRNIFTILQAAPPPEATLLTLEGEDVYNLRPKRRRSMDPLADLHPEHKYGSKKMPNARRLQQQMTRVEHLRQRICVLLRVLFPSLPYPQRFVDTAPAVELLMDQVIAAAQDQDVENLMPGRPDTELRVILCKTPRKCLHALRRKVVQLLQVLLPGMSSIESSGKQVEELLERVIASNSVAVK